MKIRYQARELYHFGVLGMKWGRRRGESSTERELHPSADHISAETIRKKHLSEMSNADIKELSNRIRLEKDYKSITAKEASAGQKFIAEILTSVSKQLITSALIGGSAFVGKKVIDFAGKKVAEAAVKKSFKGTVGWPG